ncbi:MAG: hypothetical protein JOZ52_13140, partial [Acidobacteria bacterium]|nr:hypothetical protein [Acidobacteriota bacterium]
MRASSEISQADEREEAQSFLAATRARVDERLAQLVPHETAEPVSVHTAIRWSLFAGGKRFRPALVLAAGEAFGADAEALLSTACALE